ncbi:MAG: restriction endonuclease [Candidatus Bathyarchaeia archaeon]
MNLRSRIQIILTIIDITKESSNVPIIRIANIARCPLETVEDTAKWLESKGLLTFEPPMIEIKREGRISLALEAVSAGRDPEVVCRRLGFREFEDIVAEAFKLNGFQTLTRYVFKHKGRRYEIDVLAFRGMKALCVDCKQWKRVARSKLKEALRMQMERVEALTAELNSKRLDSIISIDGETQILPVILTLVDTEMTIIDRVPIVPVTRLGRFLDEFDFHLDQLVHFKVKFKN